LSPEPSVEQRLIDADAQLVLHPHQRLPQDQRLIRQNAPPPLLAIESRPESQLGEAFRLAMEQRLHAELLRELAELVQRRRAFSEIH
jgi:hypothetical protein